MKLKINTEKLKSKFKIKGLGKRISARGSSFFTLSDGQPGGAAGTAAVALIPFRTLVSYPFSFPFGRKGKVREALSLNFRPVLGESEASLSLVPQITEQTSALTRGTAWFVSKAEVERLESQLGSEVVFWPVQAAFAAEVGGSGLVVWHDADGSAAMWFENYESQICRWLSAAEGSAEDLADWVKKYAAAAGKTIENVKIIEDEELTQEELDRCCGEALEKVGGLDLLDLSHKGADSAQQLEAFFGSAFKITKLMIAAGAVFALLSALLLFEGLSARSSFAQAPARIFAAVFGERSNNPLTSAARRLRVVTGSGDSAHLSLEATLANFTAAWKTLPRSSGLALDALRYGVERTEIQGLAGSMQAVQALNDALAKNGFAAKIGEVQQLPGSGLRFSITLAGAAR